MARKNAMVPSKGQFIGETAYFFVRNTIARDMIGHDFRRYLPLLIALFSFVLVNNLFGVFPFLLLPTPSHVGWLAVHRGDESLVGVFNLSEIVRGAFQSAYLGYYGFRAHAGRGLMKESLGLALDAAYGAVGLHRVEVNVQPTNVRSIGLVEAMGFTEEGFSRRYLRIAGRWRDHRRFAMLAEDWDALRSRGAKRRSRSAS